MKPNVLLIVLDSVRAKNTGLHGYSRGTTPFLSHLSTQSTVYEQARAPGQWSLPSHTSMFTGYHVDEHRVTSPRHSVEPGHSIWETLRDEYDYDTAMFSSQRFLTDPAFGLTAGFETVKTSKSLLPCPDAVGPRDVEQGNDLVSNDEQNVYREYLLKSLRSSSPSKALINGTSSKLSETPVEFVLPSAAKKTDFARLFLDWQERVSGPWGACINFMDAHFPYNPGTDHDHWGDSYLHRLQSSSSDDYAYHGGAAHWSERHALENLYDGAIAKLDGYIKRIINSLSKRGVLDGTLVVITADHGEGFGEQSNVRPTNRICAHNFGLHEVLLHVPLLVRVPGQSERKRVTAPASLTEFPTVVRNAIGAESSPRDFVPEQPVVASAHHTRILEFEDSIREYCTDVDRFKGHARAAYSKVDGCVEKTVRWGADSAIVHAHDAQTTEKISNESRGESDRVFERITDRNICDDGGEEMADSTKTRLKDLGYL